jgi:hypothetical protein
VPRPARHSPPSHEHLVTGPNSERGQRQKQRIRPTRNTDRVLDADQLCDLGFERAHLRAEDKAAAVEHALEGFQQIGVQGRVLSGQVYEGNRRLVRSWRRHG